MNPPERSLSLAVAVDDPSPATTDLPGLFKALGDELRMQVLRVLRDDSFSVSELCLALNQRQSGLSHHLKVLLDAGLLERRREGTTIYYRRALPAGAGAALRGHILAELDALTIDRGLARRLDSVHRQREENSLAFFQANIARFREQQELIADWRDYADASLQLLVRAGPGRRRTLLEVGPGDGSLLLELAPLAERVVAIDNSAAMLDAARATAAGLDNVAFILGEPANITLEAPGADAAVMNMVLHHTPDPAAVLSATAGLLADSGFLVVAELCAHDQAWTREHCGDLWLGFEPAQLSAWGQAAGLAPISEVFIAQRNGFQIQVRLFQKQNEGSNT